MDVTVRVHRLHMRETGWSAGAFAERRHRVRAYLRGLHRHRRFHLLHDVGGFLYAEAVRDVVAETGLPAVTHLLILMGPYLAESGAPAIITELFHELQALQCGVSAAVITTSRAEQAYYRRAFAALTPDELIFNGVTVPQADPDRVRYWRRVISPEGAVVLFMGGRLGDRAKGGDRACALAAALRNKGVPVRLVGTDLRPSETPPAIREAIQTLGRLPELDLWALLKAVDIVVCPSRYEAFGLLAVEAATAGTMVFASAVGGHVDTVPAVGGVLLDDASWAEPSSELVSRVAGLVGCWKLSPSRPLPETLSAEGACRRVAALHARVLDSQ